MRFTTTINNQKCMEWGLNATQGILVSLLYEASSWAKEIVIEDKVYYFVSRNLIIQELPMFFEKADTVYRTLKLLAEKGIIEYKKHNGMDLICLTKKGKSWNFVENNSEKNPNSEKFPNKLGKKSENNSEKNPTYKDTNIHKDINNKGDNIVTNNNKTAEKNIPPVANALRQEIKMLIGSRNITVEQILKYNEPIDRIKEVFKHCNLYGEDDRSLCAYLKYGWDLVPPKPKPIEPTKPASAYKYLW